MIQEHKQAGQDVGQQQELADQMEGRIQPRDGTPGGEQKEIDETTTAKQLDDNWHKKVHG